MLFAARPPNISGRPEPVEGRDQADVTIDNWSGRSMRCLVTIRRQLCPGQPSFAVERRSLEQVRWAVDAGVELIHVRERDFEAACLAARSSPTSWRLRAAHPLASSSTIGWTWQWRPAPTACTCGAIRSRLRRHAGWRRSWSAGPFDSAAEAKAGACGSDYLIAGTVFLSPLKVKERRFRASGAQRHRCRRDRAGARHRGVTADLGRRREHRRTEPSR